ncbi:hypothetical protein D3C77_410190 [compost metagenome]
MLTRFHQLSFQLLALGDVDPAAQQPLQLPVSAVERHGPLIGIGALAVDLDATVDEQWFRVLEQTQVVRVQLSSQLRRNDADIGQAMPSGILQT